MKILFTRFPLESAYGGAEIQTLSLMQGLIARGHAVAFAGSCPVLLKACKEHRIPFVEWHIGKPPVTKWGALSFAWRKNRMKQKLERLLGNFGRLDCIAMLSMSEKLLLTDVAVGQNIRVFWIEHDRIGRWLTSSPWLKDMVKQSAHAVTIPVSHLSGKIYEQLGWDPETIKPIPNGIDASRVMVSLTNHDTATLRQAQGDRHHQAQSDRHCQAQGDRLHLGCIARLSPEKGVDVLIRALALQPAHVTLEIVGQGKEKSALQSLTKELSLTERVTFSPPSKDIGTIYGRFDALVLPSRDNDPFGLVAAEAMMLGMPVIVTDTCGIAGYLKDGEDALIARANDVQSLSDTLNRLLDPAIFNTCAKQASQSAHKKFSAESMVQMYEHVFTGAQPLPLRS